MADVRRQGAEIGDGLVDEDDAWLDEDDLFAEPSEAMGMANGGIGFGAPTWAIDKMNDQDKALQPKRTRQGWRPLAGSWSVSVLD